MKVIIVLKKSTRRYKTTDVEGVRSCPTFQGQIYKFILEIKKIAKIKSQKGFKTGAGSHALHASLRGLPYFLLIVYGLSIGIP